MEQNKFNIVLTDGAQTFLESLPYDAKEKISYNIRRVLAGEKNNDYKENAKNAVKGNS